VDHRECRKGVWRLNLHPLPRVPLRLTPYLVRPKTGLPTEEHPVGGVAPRERCRALLNRG
jgi:hypothetical protein